MILWTYLIFIWTWWQQPEPKKIQINGYAQGTTYHITYFATDSLLTQQQTDSIFSVMDYSMSLYKPGSVINQFNQSPSGTTIDGHLALVIDSSIATYNASGGLFDITVQPLVKAWGFGTKNVTHYPNKKTIRSILKCVGTAHIKRQGVFLSKTKLCVTIDVNGIAQGYTVDVFADFLESKQVYNYIVEVGGEIRAKGKKPDGSSFKVGIEAPGDYDDDASIIQKVVILSNGAITTSGSYRKFHESKGKKFSHIINPQTGYPIQNQLISVTVIADKAITADAYDNVLMAMGLEKGLQFVEGRKDMAAYFIYKKTDGTISDSASSRFIQYVDNSNQ